MADVPGLLADVYFGDAETDELPDWRTELRDRDDEDDEDKPLSQSERAALTGILGFDPAEIEDEVPFSIDLQDFAAELAVATDYYHGPQAPGPNWKQVGTGPKGGKVWQFAGKRAEQKPEPKRSPAAQDLIKQADEMAGQILEKTVGAIERFGNAGQWLRERANLLRDKLESRYGPKTTLAIMASAVTLSWGAFGAGALAGSVVYIPVGVAAIPGIAIAETYRQLSKVAAKTAGAEMSQEEELTQEQIDALAKELLESLQAEWEEKVKE